MQISNNNKKLLGGAVITLLALLLAFLLIRTDILSQLETRSWDWRLAFIADPKSADPNIKIIMIDQSSLERLADEEKIYWPWPRELYVPIVEFLKLSKAKGVAFDVLYSEQSHYSVNDDQAFAESFDPRMPVILAAAVRTGQVNNENPRLSLFRQRQLERLDPARPQSLSLDKQTSPTLPDVNLPIPELLESAHSFGNVSIPNDSDGIFRHILPGTFVKDIPILSLPFALLNAVHPEIKIDTRQLSKDGEFTVKFAGPSRTYKTYSYYGILRSFQALTEGRPSVIAADEFKDSYVFVGMDAPGLLDLRPTPLSRSFPGVEYHANALDNALKNSFIKKASLGLNLVITLIFVLLGTFGCLFVNSPLRQAIVIICSVGAFVATTFMFAHAGYWVELIVPLLCMLAAKIAAFGYQYQLEGYTSRFLKNAFQFYVSPELINKIIQNPSALSLGGERKELTVFFCDIEGFTKMSESIDAQLMGQFLNTFLSEMTGIIMKNQGTVDKYIGDAIVAFWNAPISVPQHALQGVKSAMECQQRLAQMKELFEQEYGIAPKLRIGLNTGYLSVGNFGSKERFNYTVIGDVANLASRLEGANKFFGTRIMISHETFLQLPAEIPCRKLGQVQVVGKGELITVYEPLWEETDIALLPEWNKALAFLEKAQLREALNIIEKLPKAKLHQLYQERIEQQLSTDETSWNDVWSLTEK